MRIVVATAPHVKAVAPLAQAPGRAAGRGPSCSGAAARAALRLRSLRPLLHCLGRSVVRHAVGCVESTRNQSVCPDRPCSPEAKPLRGTLQVFESFFAGCSGKRRGGQSWEAH